MSSWRWVFRCVPSARESHRLCVAHSEGDAQPLYLLVYCQRGDASLHRWTARYCAIVVCECGVAAPVRSVTASNLATDLLSVSDSHSLLFPSCQRTIFVVGGDGVEPPCCRMRPCALSSRLPAYPHGRAGFFQFLNLTADASANT